MIMKFLNIVTIIAGLLITSSAHAQLIASTPVKNKITKPPRFQIIKNRTVLRIYDGKIIKNIRASSLRVRILDSQNCNGKSVKRQTLSGKKFFPKAIKLDKRTGNLAVGVLLQNCAKQNISAVFILQPKPNWSNYIVHRVAVPGKRQINDRFSTYPLRKIKVIGFIDGNLLIKHTSFKNSEALLVYKKSEKPTGKYAGCVVTQTGHSDNICPSFD
ncbi:hypothetical protein NIES267_63560 [Calothrix parasitica NIES-267]|uniref:Uncharacterized protein n=1 Tax=Calothrix parasitica NIES-267 TaxID=1973488 RepID=A0A1Z4M052_9CYAN|nr:hypothetical protein NIES267_63560 [Calothrix parasitica NIES-267]